MGPAVRPALRLFAAGASILFWELALIRWLGSNARLVAYYSNFVLTAAFFGLGVGTLASRREGLRLQRLAFPLVTTSVLLGVALAGRFHYNPGSLEEYVWIGAPAGLESVSTVGAIPTWAVLVSAYLVTAAAFVPQGYALGGLFRTLPPLRAYSAEVFGSLVGILLFSLMSLFRLPPAVWFAFGALLLFPFIERSRSQLAVAIVCSAIVVAAALPASRLFAWSPYYKLAVEPIDVVYDFETGAPIKGTRPFGHAVTVNHDFYQMMLDLRAPDQNVFLRAARDTYDAPYRDAAKLPPGRILVVGAGSGNDVSAALRSTDRPVDAVEIDPSIIDIGRALHAEKPYQNPRVTIINDDARSFFQRTPEQICAGGVWLPGQPHAAVDVHVGPPGQLHLHARVARARAAVAGPGGPALRLVRQQHAVDPPAHRQHDHRGVRSAHDHRRPRTRRGRRLPQRQPARRRCRARRQRDRQPTPVRRDPQRRLAVPLPQVAHHPAALRGLRRPHRHPRGRFAVAAAAR